MSNAADSGQIERTSDLGDKPDDVVKRWVMWLDLGRGGNAKKWRARGHKVVKRYKDDRESDRKQIRFNILYSNTEILKPALYSRTPTPDVRRRFLDQDRVARVAADVLQRTIGYHTDALDFDGLMEAVRDDYLLPGMGAARVRYVPHLEPAKRRIYVRPAGPELPTADGPVADPQAVALAPGADPAGLPLAPPAPAAPGYVHMDGSPLADPAAQVRTEGDSSFIDGEEYQKIAWEEVVPEYVPWDDWCWSPAKQWCHVDAIAFRGLLTREQCIAEFGKEIGNEIPLNWSTRGEKKDDQADDPKSLFKRAEVWEIWDRNKREVLAICRDYAAAPCKVIKDPLGLRDFFPGPEPVVAIKTTDEFMPVPEFTLYQDQATELDNLTDRIDKLVGALKYRVLYDADLPELDSLVGKGDNAMVPVRNATAFREKGGIANAIWAMPLAELAATIDKLEIQRQAVKATIWELSGIGDLMRGASNPAETATAQNLKGRYSNQRTSPRQKKIARFARDIFRLMGEIIATKFSWETLSQMSGIVLPSDADVAAAQQLLEVLSKPQPGQQPPPPQTVGALKEAANAVTRDQVMALLRSEGPRGFRIDIESDSTVAPDATDEQEQRIAFVTALAKFMEAFGPAVTSGIMSKELASEVLMFTVRAFRVGAQLEDALETLGQSAGQAALQKPDPEMIKAQAAAQATQAKAQAEEAKAQSEIRVAEAEAALDAKLAAFKAQLEADMKEKMFAMDLSAKRDMHATDMLHKSEAAQAEQAARAAEATAPTIVVGTA